MKSSNRLHFEVSERKILLRVMDVLVCVLGLYVLSSLFNFSYFSITSDKWAWTLVLVFYLLLFATIFELYQLPKTTDFNRVFKNCVLTSLLTVLFYLFTPFYTPSLPENRIQILYFFVGILGSLSLWRWSYITFISSPRFYKNTLIVGDSFDIEQLERKLSAADPHYVVCGYIQTCNTFQNSELPQLKIEALDEFLKQHLINEIIVYTPSAQGLDAELHEALIGLLKRGYNIKKYAQVYEELTQRLPVKDVTRDFYSYFPFSRSGQNKLYLFFTRVFDVLASLLGLFFLILILPIVVLLNSIANRGPLFYRQTRVGRHGKCFSIYKLRSMVEHAEQNGAQYAKKNDSRITPFGKFLRRTRLDEIPQFINVLLGDMSVIGPRPERPEFVAELKESIPFYEVRHVIKPGLTGWAQVNAKYAENETDSLEKLQYDLYYIKHRGLYLDFRIFLKTLSTIIFFRGQ
ncbi:exopolysaccharide biosynthesis polyprenyl glycosylphosphotransferase [Mesonia sp. HuA40]|uniref:exopolysaccharide biosynthesis polyprenyl glycosylphosphotransferase n=1 Tax=Mesonia sp. HuA40 TaxID=2602761 RepID=UPI0011CA9EF9|nr:exopolysaccharide biosynthesis polyprenyl glycosylphosphotransferase [Mesonia sp. HuA40]TXK72332.1 exopolysaccharide biosynthesis polyprenyl glycosylphosphotransferase [Mesonia sp. HuA40]